jgi:deazaflavin-dependent oxidoreductase (nitroreductase family)
MTAPADMRAFNRSVIDEFRANRGRVGHEPLKDARLVLLTTRGARTGRPRTTPLSYFEDGPSRIGLWASNRAAPARPAWYRNLVAHPEVTIELGVDADVARFVGIASTALGAERERLLSTLWNANPTIAAHQDRTEREIPLVVIEYDLRDPRYHPDGM